MLRNSKVIYILAAVYALLIVSLLIYFNKMRGTELEYSYDFTDFSLDAGVRPDDGSRLNIDESSQWNGVFSASPGTQLRSGDYVLTVKYISDGDNVIHYSGNSNCEKYVTLPAGSNEVSDTFSLWPSSDRFRVWLIYNGSGSLQITDITISSQKPLYTDYEYFMILTVLFGLLFPVLVYVFAKRAHFGRTEWTVSISIAVLSVVSSFPIFYGYGWRGVDTRPHLMRTDGVCTAITARRFPTIIYDNMCNDYGELSCIYPDKFLYIPGFLRKCGVSLLTSQGTMLFLINAASLIITYYCARYFCRSKMLSLIASIALCFFPHRIYVMYSGGQAMGMGVAALFVPVVLVGLYDVFFDKGEKWYLLSIGICGLLCSHILTLVLNVIICFITAVFAVIVLIIKKDTNDRIRSIIISLSKAVGVFILLSLSTLVPFIYYYNTGLSLEVNKFNFLKCRRSLADSFLSDNGFYVYILFGLMIAVLIYNRKRKVKDDEPKDGYSGMYGGFLLAVGFMLFWMSTRTFPWKPISNIEFIYDKLCMFQFSERFLMVGMPAMCMGLAIICRDIFEKHGKIVTRLAAAFVFACICLGCHTAYIQIKYCEVCILDRMTADIYYTLIEYLPTGSEVSFYESNVPNCGDWDSVDNISYIKNGTSIHYEYTCRTEGNYMEFPLFYYKGYHAYDASGNELKITKSDHNRITLDLVKSSEPQVIDIVFKVHPVFSVCAVISFASTVVLYVYIWKRKKSRSLSSP